MRIIFINEDILINADKMRPHKQGSSAFRGLFFHLRSAGFGLPNRPLAMPNLDSPGENNPSWPSTFMGCPSSQGFIAHNVKVSVQSQCKMHQENHPGIRFLHRHAMCRSKIWNICFFADDPCFWGRIGSRLQRRSSFMKTILILGPAPLLLRSPKFDP